MNYRRLYGIGYVYYALMTLLAVTFYRERSIFLDIAFHLFEMMRTGAFAIQNFRFAAAATQVFPLLAIKAGASLSTVMVVYSVGFIVFYSAVYGLLGLMKQYRIALAFLICQSLFATDTFYWMQSELPQGLAFMFLSLGVISHMMEQGSTPFKVILLALLLVTTAFAHPLLVFPFAFAILFLFQLTNGAQQKKLLVAALAFYFLITAIKVHFFKTGYDSNAFDGLKNFTKLFPYLDLHANKVFLKRCLLRYALIPVSVIAIGVVYLKQRRYLQLVVITAFFFGYLLLINVCNPTDQTPLFYIENMYLALGLILALPIVFVVLPRADGWGFRFPASLIMLVTVFATARIFEKHRFYTNRLAWIEQYWQQHSNEKLMIAENALPANPLIMVWASPYEFWLLSTSCNKPTASILFLKDLKSMDYAAGQQKQFLTTWGSFDYKVLPAAYFHFEDTVSSYKVVR